MTFEKRKKIWEPANARERCPRHWTEKRDAFFFSLSLFDEYSGCSMIRKFGLSNRSKFIRRARLLRRHRRDANLRRSSSSKKFVRIVCESIHM
jgi:hypothetical protein